MDFEIIDADDDADALAICHFASILLSPACPKLRNVSSLTGNVFFHGLWHSEHPLRFFDAAQMDKDSFQLLLNTIASGAFRNSAASL